jgi:hypothetical protein
MRTFHTGGVASAADITQGLPRVEELFEARIPKAKATIAEINGKITKILMKRIDLKFILQMMLKQENMQLNIMLN